MNLRAIANGVIQPINPNVPIVVQVSTGYTTEDSGRRAPSFAPPVTVQGQIQALSNGEIQHLDSLNIQNVKNAIYINGQLNGLVRPDGKGGDLITMQDGTQWLVVIVIENWPEWVKVGVTRQNIARNDPGFTPSLDFSNPDNSQNLPRTA